MRQIGEQWVEKGVHDNKNHMYVAVENIGESCLGCAFGCESNDVCHYCMAEFGKCPVNKSDVIIKDLGILNKDGCLPAPWDSTKYPKITVLFGNVYNIEVMEGFWFMQVRGDTKEKAIERWNRRA
jgi:hypothetical protein